MFSWGIKVETSWVWFMNAINSHVICNRKSEYLNCTEFLPRALLKLAVTCKLPVWEEAQPTTSVLYWGEFGSVRVWLDLTCAHFNVYVHGSRNAVCWRIYWRIRRTQESKLYNDIHLILKTSWESLQKKTKNHLSHLEPAKSKDFQK